MRTYSASPFKFCSACLLEAHLLKPKPECSNLTKRTSSQVCSVLSQLTWQHFSKTKTKLWMLFITPAFSVYVLSCLFTAPLWIRFRLMKLLSAVLHWLAWKFLGGPSFWWRRASTAHPLVTEGSCWRAACPAVCCWAHTSLHLHRKKCYELLP